MESDFSLIFVAVWSCPPAPPLPSASPFALPHKAGSFGEARLWVVAFRARRSRYRIRYCALRRQRRDQRDHSTEALMAWAHWGGASQGAAQVEHRVLSLRTGERNSILAVVNEHPKIKRRALRRCGGGSRTPRPSPQE